MPFRQLFPLKGYYFSHIFFTLIKTTYTHRELV